MYHVKKVLNNNVVLAEECGREIVLVGRGLGFIQEIDEPRIEKKFVLEENTGDKLRGLLESVDEKVIGLAEEIIAMIEQQTGKKLSQHIHISLADHIGFATDRMRLGIEIRNPFNDELKVLYPEEYALAEKAVLMVADRLGTVLPSDETGIIAMHIHAGMENNSLSKTVRYANIIGELVETIEREMGISVDRGSIDYARLVTHLRFAFDRIDKDKPIDNPLLGTIKKKYKRAYIVAKKLENVIEGYLDKRVPEGEVGYLAIHIERAAEAAEEGNDA